MNPDDEGKLLEQRTRRQVVDHLKLLPGDYFRSIARTLHLSSGAARHHLAVLAKEDVVRSERIGGRLRYFAVARDVANPLNETFRRYWKYRDLRLRVWSAVSRLPDAGPSSVAEALGVSRQLASYHLHRLAEMGLVVHNHGRYRAVAAANGDSGAVANTRP